MSLISIVTRCVHIQKVSGCDLVTILDSVNCGELRIYKQSLGREETEALVQAMESHVKGLVLSDVTLDIEALNKYSGRGKWRHFVCEEETAARYREELRSWASNKGWDVEHDIEVVFKMIKRN